MGFKLKSKYSPTGDQPNAIEKLVDGIQKGEVYQTLEGVTGSGKTFTVANVINKLNKQTLVLAHNKTLAAQLFLELKDYFPENRVEYFVSYYDYYQPEAYIPVTNTYIEKDLSINEEIEKMRLSTTSSLLSGRNDVIVVASVSCLYGIGNPADYKKNTITLNKNSNISRTDLLKKLSHSLYSRTIDEIEPGSFRVTGDIVEVFLSYSDKIIRINFFGDEIEFIEEIYYMPKKIVKRIDSIKIFPANMFSTQKEVLNKAMDKIRIDLGKQVSYFKEISKNLEAKRLEERTLFDLEMMQELGYCSGIENYSRYIDGRDPEPDRFVFSTTLMMIF